MHLEQNQHLFPVGLMTPYDFQLWIIIKPFLQDVGQNLHVHRSIETYNRQRQRGGNTKTGTGEWDASTNKRASSATKRRGNRLQASKAMQRCWFQPHDTLSGFSAPQNCRRISFCYFKLMEFMIICYSNHRKLTQWVTTQNIINLSITIQSQVLWF